MTSCASSGRSGASTRASAARTSSRERLRAFDLARQDCFLPDVGQQEQIRVRQDLDGAIEPAQSLVGAGEKRPQPGIEFESRFRRQRLRQEGAVSLRLLQPAPGAEGGGAGPRTYVRPADTRSRERILIIVPRTYGPLGPSLLPLRQTYGAGSGKATGASPAEAGRSAEAVEGLAGGAGDHIAGRRHPRRLLQGPAGPDRRPAAPRARSAAACAA